MLFLKVLILNFVGLNSFFLNLTLALVKVSSSKTLKHYLFELTKKPAFVRKIVFHDGKWMHNTNWPQLLKVVSKIAPAADSAQRELLAYAILDKVTKVKSVVIDEEVPVLKTKDKKVAHMVWDYGKGKKFYATDQASSEKKGHFGNPVVAENVLLKKESALLEKEESWFRPEPIRHVTVNVSDLRLKLRANETFLSTLSDEDRKELVRIVGMMSAEDIGTKFNLDSQQVKDIKELIEWLALSRADI